MRVNSAGLALHWFHFDAAVQFPAARKMTQRIDVRSHVAAHRNRVRRRTHPVLRYHIAVLFGQSEEERRVRRVVRHAHEIGLPQIVDFCALQSSQQIAHRCAVPRRRGSGFLAVLRRGFAGTTGSSFDAQRPKRYCRRYPAVRLVMLTVTVPLASIEYRSSISCFIASADRTTSASSASLTAGSNGKRISSQTVTSPAGCPPSFR